MTFDALQTELRAFFRFGFPALLSNSFLPNILHKILPFIATHTYSYLAWGSMVEFYFFRQCCDYLS